MVIESMVSLLSQKINMHHPAILLAAGQSTRFGSQKLLHPLSNGVPMVVQSARNLKRVFERVIVVISPEYLSLSKLLEAEGVEVVINHRAREGMGTSLALGVTSTVEAKGWVIALGDMPFISTSTLQVVGSRLVLGTMLVAPFYQGQRGHPVGFNATFCDELLALSGDKGAGALIKRESTQLTKIETQDKGVLWDIDQAEDLKTSLA